MNENDPLSELIRIPLGHNHTNIAVSSRIGSKLGSALHFRYSIVIPRFTHSANTCLILTLSDPGYFRQLTTWGGFKS